MRRPDQSCQFRDEMVDLVSSETGPVDLAPVAQQQQKALPGDGERMPEDVPQEPRPRPASGSLRSALRQRPSIRHRVQNLEQRDDPNFEARSR